jgi:hypothetical protein
MISCVSWISCGAPFFCFIVVILHNNILFCEYLSTLKNKNPKKAQHVCCFVPMVQHYPTLSVNFQIIEERNSIKIELKSNKSM